MTKQELINLWHEFYALLAQGNPPVGLLLLALNGAAFIFWISRQKGRRRANRSEVTLFSQALLIAGNLAIIFQDNIWRVLPNMPDITRLI